MKDAEAVTLGTSSLKRAAELRSDGEWVSQRLRDGARIVPVWRGKLMVTGGTSVSLAYRGQSDPVLAELKEPPVFIGLDESDEPIFAADLSSWTPEEGVDEAQIRAFVDRSEQVHPSESRTGASFRELRSILTGLSRFEAEVAATARALFMWHSTHKFCANCGAASEPKMAGWQRGCPVCGHQHFPRTDPVVIMLVTRGDRVLLGRSPGWPERMYSLLAGFVEPGETLEAAVRREVFEETRVEVGEVTYLASQPWPFPTSLMFGCHGVATSTDITIDPVEIDAARWLTRSEVLEVFSGNHPKIDPPREGAIAHFLLKKWLSDQLN